MLYPTADALTVISNQNITVAYYMFGGGSTYAAVIGLTQNFERKILNSTYI